MHIKPIELTGKFVRLVPLKAEHLDELCAVGLEKRLWNLSPTNIGNRSSMEAYIRSALNDQKFGIALPFVTIENSSNKAVGSTRFGNIDVLNRKVEIGWTWIAPEWQRTYVNTEAKLLMLRHAFEVWECIRVEFKTDVLNEKSRNSIARLGAKEEGIFRNHMITESGRFRDSIYFSIIESEWPEIKSRLNSMLET